MAVLVEDRMNFETSVRSVETRMSSTSEDISPMAQTGSPTEDFRCGICNKTYSRRDLRDRHRRRCIKTAGQERLSKRKSCEICAQKKLRCSMTRPACTRCVQIGTPCHYPPSSIPPRIPEPQDSPPPTGTTSVASSIHTPASASTQSSISSNAMVHNMTADNSSSAMALDDVPTTMAGHAARNMPMPNQQPTTTANHYDPMTATAWSPFGTSNMDSVVRALDGNLFCHGGALPWGDDFSSLADPMSVGSAFPGGMEDSAAPASSYFIPLHEISKPVASLEAPPPGPMTVDNYNNTSPYNVPSLPSLSSTSSDSAWRDGSTRGDEVDITALIMRNNSPPRLILGHNFIPKLGTLSKRETDDTYQDLFALLRGYPGLILDRDFWSPFVHHRLYRCSMGGMAEPLGIALACVSAHASSVKSSHGFVDRMINEEREKLVRNFHLHINDIPETCLAAVHAVCVYQILGLFGDNFIPAAIKPHAPKEATERGREETERAAELHSSFLLKMIRRLYKMNQESMQIHHTDENDWTRWKFTESLRRNLFFVNMINILGAKARKLNEHYFEPLGDEIVLDLPLPAPEFMWRCCSEEEWLVAREQTMGQPATSLKLPDGVQCPTGPRTLREMLELDKAGTLDVSTLLPITRMILACSKVAPKGDSLSRGL
ncbi:hypothetical protein BBP40_003532 [Aspergillus hancockii]|nr:hypothetical protein BBP40_003532 [Aspergillus hancockii]